MSSDTSNKRVVWLVVVLLICTNVVSILVLVWLQTQNQKLRQQLAVTPASSLVQSNSNSKPDSRVYDAAQRGQLEQLIAALEERPDLLNARPYDSLSTPLHAAAYYRRAAVVGELLARKADVNATNRGGLTPLHDCISRGTTEIAGMLLEHGASLTARNLEGCRRPWSMP
jgi:ankyrin repeat protein